MDYQPQGFRVLADSNGTGKVLGGFKFQQKYFFQSNFKYQTSSKLGEDVS